jgi:flagellar biosynthesis protein FliP
MSVIAGFGFVFLLLGLSLRFLKRYAPGAAGARSGLRMEVVQRIGVGPRQGIAVVRIGDRLLAVSLGEGGVRPLLELGEEEREALAAADEARAAAPGMAAAAAAPLASLLGSGSSASSPDRRPLKALLRSALRGAAVVLIALGIAATAGVEIAPAQAPATTVEQADDMISRLAPEIDVRVGDAGEGLRLTGTVGVVVMLGLLTLLPTLLLMMTSFTRILIVLHFLRQALGTQSAPPAHLMAALALLLTGFVMAPTLSEVNRAALQPWMEGEIEQGEMLAAAIVPFREFMLTETRDRDIATFLDLSTTQDVQTADDVPLVVLLSAFVTSELRTAFQIGFALFLPFIVIDIVVASVLMSMGMFMLPPPMIALPFKILLFVLVDGWTLIVQGLITSFT